MEEKTPRPSEENRSAGQDFIHKIGPWGCALFLGLFILTTALCFTAGSDPIPGYEPPQPEEYYATHPEALMAELEDAVFPQLPYDMSVGMVGDQVTVYIAAEDLVLGRAALLQTFGHDLLMFEEK